jgi:CubicO group peptidase (beta-lactamase class C family)
MMWKITMALAAIVGLGQAQPAPEESLAAIDEILQQAVRRGDVPGAVVMVASKDRILYQGAAGVMNAAAKRTMRTDAIFRIQSMTKPFTAAAILMLQEEGKLSVEDPASKYLPALKDRGVVASLDEGTGTFTTRRANGEVLIRHLLSNTSGFGYSFSNPALKAMVANAGKPPEELPLLHDPGAQWTYGMGAKLLGQIVEKVDGRTLDAFFDARIFKPLGLTDTFYLVPDAKRARVATLNRRDGARLAEAANPARMGSRAMGDGGLYSTAGDYMRFLQMLLNDGRGDVALLRKESIEEMTRNQIGELFVRTQQSTDPKISLPFPFGAGRDTFGFGFQIAAANPEMPLLRSAGSYSWSGSDNTHFWVDPGRGVAAVVMTQLTPFYDERCMKLVSDVEEAVGRALRR